MEEKETEIQNKQKAVNKVTLLRPYISIIITPNVYMTKFTNQKAWCG